MRTRIVSAFPGTGKSYYHNKHPEKTLDSDSSHFSWIVKENGDKERHPDFPANYIQHIKNNIGKYEFIFASTHEAVRKALLDNCLYFYLIYPRNTWKDMYIEKYRKRRSDENFIKLLSDNWEKWIRECDFCENGCQNICMTWPDLEHELDHIIRSENGDS